MMITADEYRQMAEQCFGWAREAQADEVRLCYTNLAQTWLEAARWTERRKSALAGQAPFKRKAA